MKTALFISLILLPPFGATAQELCLAVLGSAGTEVRSATGIVLAYTLGETSFHAPAANERPAPRPTESIEPPQALAPLALELAWLPVEIRVLPNPFSDWLEVSLESPSAVQLEIQLYDLHSREVLHFRTRPGEPSALLPTAALPAGRYILTVSERKGRLLVTRSVEKA